MGAEGAAPIDLAVLGDIVLRVDGGSEIPLAPQRARILAILGAAAGRVVSRAELVEDLWADDSEASRHRLNQQITQLRRVLGSGLRIEHHHDGFCLAGDLPRIDAVRFEALLAGAEALAVAERHTRYLAALALWRGPPFHGVDSLLVDDARHALEARRSATELHLADCEIALHLPGAAVELLRRRSDDDPTAADVTIRLATLLAIAQRDVEARRIVGRHRSARREAGFSHRSRPRRPRAGDPAPRVQHPADDGAPDRPRPCLLPPGAARASSDDRRRGQGRPRPRAGAARR